MKKMFRRLIMATLLSTPTGLWGQSVVNSYPYTCGFETEAEASQWQLVNSNNNAWVIGTATQHAGQRSLYISDDAGENNAYTNIAASASYAYLTLYMESTSDYEISFDWQGYGESNYDYMRAWIVPEEYLLSANVLPNGGSVTSSSQLSTNATYNPPTAIDLANGKINQSSVWRHLESHVSVATSGYYKLVLMWANDASLGSNPPAAIDQVKIRAIPCRSVTNLRIAAVGAESVTLSWNASPSNPERYIINYSNSGYAETTDTSIVIGDLDPNTQYSFEVLAQCSSESRSLSAAIDVHTACAARDLPYTVDFESDLNDETYTLPYCWNRLVVGNPYYDHYPYVYEDYSQYSYSGENALYYYAYSSNYYADTVLMVLPQVNVEEFPMINNQIVFWGQTSSYYGNLVKLIVGTMSNPSDIHSFVPGREITFASDEYTELKAPLSPQRETSNAFPAIMMLKPTSGSISMYIDDVTVRVAPDCDYPSAFRSTGRTSNSIDLDWFNTCINPTQWLLEISHNGDTSTLVLDDNEVSYTIVDSSYANPRMGALVRYTLEGLTHNTTYNIRLRCISGNDTTGWAQNPLRVRTSNTESDILAFELYDDEIRRGDAIIDSVEHRVTVPIYYTESLEDSWGNFTLSDYAEMFLFDGDELIDIYSFYNLLEYAEPNVSLYVRVMAEDGENYTDWEIIFETEACSSPRNLEVEPGRTFLHAFWTNLDPSVLGYAAICSPVPLDSAALANAEYIEVNADEYTFTGLERETLYHIYLRSLCATDNSSWVNADIRTVGLVFCDTVVIANDTLQNSHVPMYSDAQDNHYRMQAVYPASMLKDLKGEELRNLTFFPVGTSVGEEGDWAGPLGNVFTVKLATTTQNDVSRNWVNGDAVTVFHGTIATVTPEGGMTFTFNTPFTYTGGNLVVELLSEHAKQYSECPFYGTARTGASRHEYGNSYLTGAGIDEDFLPKFMTALCVNDTACPTVRNVTFSDIDEHDVTISWTASDGDYAIGCDVIMSTTEIDDLDNYSGEIAYSGSDTTFTATGLLDYTLYHVYIRTNCNDGLGHDDGTSQWVYRQVHTASECRIADSITPVITSRTTATIKWVNTGASLGQTDHFGCFFSDTPLDESTLDSDVPHYHSSVDSLNLDNLLPGHTYYFYIHNHCTDIGTHSPWTSLVFSMYDSMPAVVNLHGDPVAHTSIRAVWETDTARFADETAWQVAITTPGGTPAEGDWIVVTERNHTFIGLSSATAYDIHVRPYNILTLQHGSSTVETITTHLLPSTCIDQGFDHSGGFNFSTSYYTPIYGYWADTRQRTQSIYPASMLSNLVGKTITSLRYYPIDEYDYYGIEGLPDNTFTVWMTTTDIDSFDEENMEFIDDNLTQVYTGTLPASEEDGMLVLFDTPFTYTGGNLVIEFKKDYEGGAYTSMAFQGIEMTGASLLQYEYDSYYGTESEEIVDDFLPIFQACYAGSEESCYQEANLTADDIENNSATVFWMPGNQETSWQYAYGTEEMDDATLEANSLSTTVTSVRLTGLLGDKDYYFYVRHQCNDASYTPWQSIRFATLPTCGLPTLLEADNITDTSAALHAEPSEIGSPEGYLFRYWTEVGPELVQPSSSEDAEITGLLPNTVYFYDVQAICGIGDSSRRTAPLSFLTRCTPAALPLVSSFEDDDAVLPCWRTVSMDPDEKNPIMIYEDYIEGRKYLRFSSYNSSPDYNQYAFSPLFSGEAEMRASIKYYTERSSDHLWFGYSTGWTTDPNDFIWTDKYYTSSSETFYHTVLPADAKRIAIHYYGDYAYYAYIDSVFVDIIHDYTVNAESANASMGSVDGQTGTLRELSVDTLTAIENEGYHFDHWADASGNIVSTDNPYVFTVLGNRDLFAHFAPNVYTISVMLPPHQDSRGTRSGGGSYNYLDTAVIAVTPATGFQFLRWNDGDTNNPRSVVVTGDAMFMATLDTAVYPVTTAAREPEMGSVVAPATVKHFTSVTLRALTNYGYHFTHWSNANEDAVSTDTFFTVNPVIGPIIAYANYDYNQYTVNAVSNNNAWGAAFGSRSVNYLTPVTLTANPNPGFHLVRWSNGETSRTISVNATANLTLTAIFDTNIYVVSAHPRDTAMGIVHSVDSARHFTSVAILAEEKYGYSFVNWTDNSGRVVGTDRLYEVDSVMGAIHVTANFTPLRFTVAGHTSNPTRGSVRGTSTVSYLFPVILTASANPGYTFSHWSNGSTDNPVTIIATCDSNLTAIFDKMDYTIQLTSADTTMGYVTGSGHYPYGASATATAIPYYGYHFLRWSNGITSASATFSVKENVNVTAYFDYNQYTVNGSANNPAMGSVSGSGRTNYLSAVTLTANANPGYHLSHWSTGDTTVTINVTALRDTVVTAFFAPNRYAIRGISDNPAMGSVAGSDTADYATSVTLTAVPATGYHFTAWNDGNSDNPRVVTAIADSLFTASFAINSYTVVVRYNSAQGSIADSTGMPVADETSFPVLHGDTLVFVATPATSYRTGGWSDGIHTFAGSDTLRYVALRNATLNAIFTDAGSAVVSVTANDPAMGVVIGSGAYHRDSEVHILAIPNANYHFLHWLVNGNEGTVDSADHRFVLADDITFQAVFAIDTHSVTLAADPTMGSVSGSGLYPYGSSATISAAGINHHHFTHWNDGNADNPRSVTVNRSLSFSALFAIDRHAVNVAANDTLMGSATAVDSADYGTSVTLHATPNHGYHFLRWSNNSTDSTLTLTVDGDINLTALFAPDSYSVTAVSDNTLMGTVAGSTSADYLSTVTLVATPNYGYRFDHWSNGSTDSLIYIEVLRDSTLTAFFSHQAFTVSIDHDTAMGSVLGVGTYDYLSAVTLRAMPNTGYRFVDWSTGEETDTLDIVVNGNIHLSATFAARVYTVSAHADATMGHVAGSGSIAHFQSTTLVATANNGYHFTGWTTTGGTILSTESTLVVFPVSDTAFTALFAPNRYAVNLSCNDTLMGTVAGPDSADFRSSVTVTATPHYGYHLDRWNNGLGSESLLVEVESDTTLIASFAPNTYTVTGRSDNTGLGTVTGTASVSYLTPVTLVAHPAEGHHLVKWSDGSTAESLTVIADSNKTRTAFFAIDTHHVVLLCNTDLGTVSGSGTYTYGTTVTLAVTPAAHHHFLRWSDGVTDNPRTYVVTADTTLTAILDVDSCTVALSVSSSNGTVSGSGTYPYGSSVIISATPAEHFSFLQWSDNITDNPRTLIVTSNISLTAIFSAEHYTVAASCDTTMGTVSGVGSYAYGARATLTALPKTHYHFLRWSDGSTVNPREFTVENDVNLTAFFAIDSFTVALSTDASTGSVSGSGTYPYGSTVTLAATPAPHYHFVSWSDGNTVNPRSVTLHSDINLSALFAIDSFTVTLLCDTTAGTVSGSGTYPYGTSLSLVATPKGYHTFQGWSDGNSDNPRAFTVESNTTLTALFTIDSFYVSVNYNASRGKVTGTGLYAKGETATLTATGHNRFHFVRWNDGSTVNPRSITVMNDVVLTATFEYDSILLIVDVNNSAWGTTSPEPGTHVYHVGDEVVLTATPYDGSTFVNWSIQGANFDLIGNNAYGTLNAALAGATIHATANFNSSVGIDEAGSVDIVLFPNPASGNVTLQGVRSGSQVSVVDMNGRTVRDFEAATDNLRIDISDLAQGAYFVRITDGGTNTIRKLIVK